MCHHLVGLVVLGQRWYNPPISRFTTQDAKTYLNDPADGNRYAYAADSPITYEDPTGESFTSVFGDVVEGLTGVVTGLGDIATGLAFIALTSIETGGLGAVVGIAVVGYGIYETYTGITAFADI